MNEKCRPNLQKVNLLHNTRKKIFCEHRPSEACFPSYGLLMIKKNVKKMTTLSFHTDIARDKLIWSNFLPPCLTGAVYRDFLRHVLPELLQDVALQTSIHLRFMHDGAPPRFLLAGWEFLNDFFSGTMDRTRWTSSMACFFPWLKCLKFLSLGISKLYSSCYISRWRPALATTNTESIWDDSYDTWNFPASQATTLQSCNLLGRSSSCTLWAFSIMFRRL